MIEIAAVVSMLMYGPMSFHITEEPLTLSASYCDKDGQPVDCAEAYEYRADHDFDYQHATYTLMPEGWGIRK